MTRCSDPRDAVELLMLRERMRDWRFYDHLRTDREAPSRKPQVGTYTPVLASDGSDLAAAVQTVREIGDAQEMDDAIADAFPGAHVEVTSTDTDISNSKCTSTACFGRSRPPSYRTALCATFCSSPLCCRRGHRR
jgi:predicted ATPase